MPSSFSPAYVLGGWLHAIHFVTGPAANPSLQIEGSEQGVGNADVYVQQEGRKKPQKQTQKVPETYHAMYTCTLLLLLCFSINVFVAA